jgi:hypothetical protein
MGSGKFLVDNAPTNIEDVTKFNCNRKSSNPENPFLNVPEIPNFDVWSNKKQ